MFMSYLKTLFESIITEEINITKVTDAIRKRKPVEITYEDGTSETIDMEVIAHNHDELGDGEYKWESVGELPVRLGYGSAVVYNNEIHILGGPYSSNPNHYKWNGTEWVSLSALPIPAPSSIVYNGELHIMKNTDHYKWDATNSSWVAVSTIPGGVYSSVVYKLAE